MQLLIVPRPSGMKLEMDVGGGNQSVSGARSSMGTPVLILGILIDTSGHPGPQTGWSVSPLAAGTLSLICVLNLASDVKPNCKHLKLHLSCLW